MELKSISDRLKQKEKMSKRGQVSGLVFSILSLGVAIIVFVLVTVIAQELRDTQASGTEAYSAANKSLVGLGTFGDFVTIIVLAVVAGVVIGIIFGAFGFTLQPGGERR